MLEKTIARHPDARQPRLLLVETLLRQGRHSEAVTVAARLAQETSDDPSTYAALGQAQLAAGEMSQASATFAKLVQMTPDSSSAQYALGRALFATGELPKARLALEKAIALSADTLPAKLLLADALYRSNNAAAALALAQQATHDHPSDASAKAALGEFYTRNGRHTEALEMQEAAFQLSPERTSLLRYHAALTRTGKPEQARRAIEKYLALNPLDFDVRFYYAGEMMRTGEKNSAINHYEMLPADYAERAIVWNNLAWLYGATNFTKAISYAEKAVALQPDSPSIADTLGWLWVERGEPARAVPLLAKAWNIGRDFPSIGYHYAEALARSGQAALAVAILRELAAAKPFDEQPAAVNLLRDLEKRQAP